DVPQQPPLSRTFAELHEGLSEVTARPPVSDVQLQDALEFGPRFLQASGVKQTKAEYSPQLGILRVLRDARLELANRLFPAAGKDQDPRQVVRGVFGEGVERTCALHRADGVGELSLCR